MNHQFKSCLNSDVYVVVVCAVTIERLKRLNIVYMHCHQN